MNFPIWISTGQCPLCGCWLEGDTDDEVQDDLDRHVLHCSGREPTE